MKIKIITTTTDSYKVAKNIAKLLIENKLSPCVQIIKNVQSLYNWQDNLEESVEILLNIKTISEKVSHCIKMIHNYHNYDIPEIIILDSEILTNDYNEWFNLNIRKM